MPEFLSRLWEWFKARSNAQQAFIIAGVVIVLGAASRVMAFIAGLAFLAALTGLTVQLVRRRPVRIWAIAAGGSLVLVLIFAGFASAIYGPESEDQAEVTQVEEPVAEEEPEPPREQEEGPAPEPQEEQAQEEPAPEPEPEEPNVEEEVVAAVEGAGYLGSVEDVEVTEQVAGDVGRYSVLVLMESQELADATLLGAMEDHQDVYQSIYTSDVAKQISDVAVVSRVDGPTMTLDPAYKTSIDRKTAQHIDWQSDDDMQNLPAYWKEEYVAPELQKQ